MEFVYKIAVLSQIQNEDKKKRVLEFYLFFQIFKSPQLSSPASWDNHQLKHCQWTHKAKMWLALQMFSL